MQSNHDLWDKILFAFVPIQLITMIFLSFYLLVENVPNSKIPFYSAILTLYTLVTFVIIVPLSYISLLIHKCNFDIVKFQIMLPRFKLRCKLKYMTLFERVESNTKYGFSVGPIKVITFPIIGQVKLKTELKTSGGNLI